ncbi:MAG: hypothetical protein QE271_03100 [Bacteriovoracaceae bacterium]|nr:hypothetical protein [Bacteriovoracaceae bacterium]
MTWNLKDLKDWNLKETLGKYLPTKNFDQYLKQARHVYDQGMKDISQLVNHSDIKKIKLRVEKEIKQLEVSIDKAINKDMTLIKKYWAEKKVELGELQNSLKSFGEKKIEKVKRTTKVKVKKIKRTTAKKAPSKAN